jgi:hypothetical protein
MIYQQIDEHCEKQLAPLRSEEDDIKKQMGMFDHKIPLEDSKKKEREMKEQRESLRKRQRSIWSEMSRIREDTFKNLLAEEYGVKRDHPKFDKAFSIAWEHGHSCGYNDVEIYFSEIAELLI